VGNERLHGSFRRRQWIIHIRGRWFLGRGFHRLWIAKYWRSCWDIRPAGTGRNLGFSDTADETLSLIIVIVDGKGGDAPPGAAAVAWRSMPAPSCFHVRGPFPPRFFSVPWKASGKAARLVRAEFDAANAPPPAPAAAAEKERVHESRERRPRPPERDVLRDYRGNPD
jgi:hypothetical protein